MEEDIFGKLHTIKEDKENNKYNFLYHINLRKSEKNIKESVISYFSSQKIIQDIKFIMSGDNLHGNQPIKFYSEKITLTKIELLERQLILGKKVSDIDEKHKIWTRKLFG